MLKDALRLISQMKDHGIIERYAIGGAVGATFYIEPAETEDLDIFVALQQHGPLLSLTPIYEYMKARGCSVDGEYIVVRDWPVQFLPPSDALDEEALAEALPTMLGDVATCVMSPEHLGAIALRTGRLKDKLRLAQFIQSGVLDIDKFEGILQRHGLQSKWERFIALYGEDNQ